MSAAPLSKSRRDALLAAIGEQAETFADAGIRSEEKRTLPSETATLLADLGFFRLKTPAELGGTPLDPLEFWDVIEELAYVDASVAWAAMIGAGCGGLAGGWLPAADRIFAPGAPPPVVAGQLSPRGAGTPVPGGYTVTGRWGFSSGITHAGWLIGAFKPVYETDHGGSTSGGFGGVVPPGEQGGSTSGGFGGVVPPGEQGGSGDAQFLVFALPKAQAEVIDNWHVAGLQGTGSLDWRLESVFVPSDMTYQLGSAAIRGGPLFRLGMPAFVSNEVPPWAAGVARRALDDMTAIASGTARFPGGPAVSERAVFHKELGRAAVRLRAARLAHRDAMAAAWETSVAGSAPSEEQQIAVTTASVYAVETCADVVSDLFRYGGGRVLSLASPMQRHLRNLLAARQHLALSEESYETAGRFRLAAAAKRRSG